MTSDCRDENHMSIHVTTIDSIKNLQLLLILKEKLDAIRAEGRSKLSEAMEKRKVVQQYLNQVNIYKNFYNILKQVYAQNCSLRPFKHKPFPT
jgi:hypothetical protein